MAGRGVPRSTRLKKSVRTINSTYALSISVILTLVLRTSISLIRFVIIRVDITDHDECVYRMLLCEICHKGLSQMKDETMS